ncbi:MAG: hypothetical protein ACJ77K_09565 [Bacteroidia bacterium]|jgi:hypothetical protein
MIKKYWIVILLISGFLEHLYSQVVFRDSAGNWMDEAKARSNTGAVYAMFIKGSAKALKGLDFPTLKIFVLKTTKAMSS